MFVKNQTSFDPVLSRGTVYGDIAVACISLELVFDILDDGSLRVTEAAERRDTDPPDIRRTLLWRGTSVTAFGHVHGPSRAPYAAPVRIAVGSHAVDLAVYGDRRWERAPWGGWTQTPPEPFDAIPLTWNRAFGGTVTLEPGFFPGTELPHPGGPIGHPQNPDGMGFVLSEDQASQQALPNIEHPNALITRPTEAVAPAGVAPCGGRVAMRVMGEARDDLTAKLDQDLLNRHHAPPPLVFAEPLAPETPIETFGIGPASLRVAIPRSPLCVALRRGARMTPTRERIRSVHVDGDARTLRVSWAHIARYRVARAPRFVDVKEAA